MDVLGDSRLNSGRIIRLFAGRTRLRTFVQYFVAFPAYRKQIVMLSGRIVRPIIPDKRVNILRPSLKPFSRNSS